MKQLESGKVVLDENNVKFELTKELSRGGQGTVWRTTDKNTAIKFEFKNSESGEILEDTSSNEKYNLIRLLPISNDIHLTLPKSVLKNNAGYTMDILEGMQSLGKTFYEEKVEVANEWIKKNTGDYWEYLSRYILTGGKRKRLIVFLEIAKILSKLHMNGLVYCDLSPNNIFITSKGKNVNVWLIDADNINYQEETRKTGYYTPRYGAPEVTTRVKGCTFYSDSYSLAILLFEELIMNHPFVGSAENSDEADWENENQDEISFEDKIHYGLLPWILDEEDDSNSLSESELPLLNTLSEDIKKKFSRTFSKYRKETPLARMSSFEWFEMIAFELDNTAKCKKCELDYIETEENLCPWCDTKNRILKINSYSEDNKKIWSFYQEIGKNKKRIPLRMIEGISLKQTIESIFDIKLEDDKIEFSNFYFKYKFYIIENDNKKRMIGIYNKKYKDKIKLIAINEKSKKEVILEVELI